MPTDAFFRIDATRSGLVESSHPVHVAVVDAKGRLLAAAGNPERLTYWRSSAKPFQALPVVQDGAADAYGFGPEELAMACASNSSEPRHREVAARMLALAGHTEAQLACGPHPPLSAAVHEQSLREGTPPTPLWSNCSGKHAAMLALVRHRGWPVEGYARAGHPLQERILKEVERWSGVTRGALHLGIDGCTTVCFALPLSAMALAWARLGVSEEGAARRLREAMWAHPFLVAGTGRTCTDVMQAFGTRVLAKVGAEGVFSAALPELGLGVALKVESGDPRCGPPALLAVLGHLAANGHRPAFSLQGLEAHAEPVLRDTHGAPTGTLRVAGTLRFA
jgi:L-asparaginase II